MTYLRRAINRTSKQWKACACDYTPFPAWPDECVMIKGNPNVVTFANSMINGCLGCMIEKPRTQCVAQRDEATLLPSIQQFIRPGSTVYSDGWAVYNNFVNHGYVHRHLIHQDNCLNPVTAVHTQGVESYWSRVKQKIKAVYGSRLHLVHS